ncbi:MAG: hypothetical protein JWM95_1360, partial [Gemmatimonadetes bacterium]|nr:hypothetical protein [Gemmatimonadota bacterium]
MTQEESEHPSAAAYQKAVREVCPGMVSIRVILDNACVEDDFDLAVALDTQPPNAESRSRYSAAVVSRWRELLAATCPHARIEVLR